MANEVIYESLTGNIVAVIDDTQTIPALPSGYSQLSGVVGDKTAIAAMHVDIGGPALEVLDYLRFVTPASHVVDTVEVYSVQKVDGTTDVDTALPADNEAVQYRLGDANAIPGTGNGFPQEDTDQLLLGAAAVKVASGSVAGTEVLYVKAGALAIAAQTLTYV